MKKPVVRYDTFLPFKIVAGESALVFPVDHPSPLVSNGKFITTSRVMYHNKTTGVFETQNTRYIPDTWEEGVLANEMDIVVEEYL
jgi:hypothetical protein